MNLHFVSEPRPTYSTNFRVNLLSWVLSSRVSDILSKPLQNTAIQF